MVKLEQMEREKAARAQNLNFKLEHPKNLKPVEVPDYIHREPSQILKWDLHSCVINILGLLMMF